MTPTTDGTPLSLIITYPSSELRDIILATGMIDGMETSDARLENEVPPDIPIESSNPTSKTSRENSNE